MQEMIDSSPFYKNNDWDGLRKRFEEDGYLFIRGLIPADVIKKGKDAIFSYLAKNNYFEPGTNPEDGFVNTKTKEQLPRIENSPVITKMPEVKRVLEGKELTGFFEKFLNSAVRTYDYKWLRLVRENEYTGCHMDIVYMGRGSQNVVTTWIPFMEIPIELGGLAVCKGTHKDPKFQKIRETYGNLDVDRDDVGGTGWFTEDPEEILRYGGVWLTTDYHPGDCVIFTMYTFHASTTNVLKPPKYRLSCDVRFQRATEPIDERWIGEKPIGHTRFGKKDAGFKRTMEQAKKDWGLSP